MTIKRMQVYTCEKGIALEALNCSKECAELSCCGKPMQLMVEKTEDNGWEKHVPVISVENDKLKVKLGSVPHPMEEEHYIQWIEVIKGNTVIRKYLEPGEKPEAYFCKTDDQVIVREYCTVHGLWKAEKASCCGCSK